MGRRGLTYICSLIWSPFPSFDDLIKRLAFLPLNSFQWWPYCQQTPWLVILDSSWSSSKLPFQCCLLCFHSIYYSQSPRARRESLSAKHSHGCVFSCVVLPHLSSGGHLLCLWDRPLPLIHHMVGWWNGACYLLPTTKSHYILPKSTLSSCC